MVYKKTLLDADDRISGVVSVIVDLTETKKLEEKSNMLLELTQAAIAETEVLYQLSSSLIAFEDLESLLQAVVDGVADMLMANRVLLTTVDLEQREVVQFVKGGIGAANVSDDIDFEEVWDGLGGWVLRELEPVLSLKGDPDPRESLALQQRRQAQGIGAIVVVPLRYQNRTLGTLTAINRIEDADFSQKDVSLMEAMANQVASAIQNVRLLERVQRSLAETESLYQVARAIGGAQVVEEILDGLLYTVTFMTVGSVTIHVITSRDVHRKPLRADAYTVSFTSGTRKVRVTQNVSVDNIGQAAR